jgi:hypothetical protein
MTEKAENRPVYSFLPNALNALTPKVSPFRRSGVPAFRRSGVPAFRRSGVLAFWRNGVAGDDVPALRRNGVGGDDAPGVAELCRPKLGCKKLVAGSMTGPGGPQPPWSSS